MKNGLLSSIVFASTMFLGAVVPLDAAQSLKMIVRARLYLAKFRMRGPSFLFLASILLAAEDKRQTANIRGGECTWYKCLYV